MKTKLKMLIPVVLAAILALLGTGQAGAANGQRNYYASQYAKTSEGYNAVKAYIYPSWHCDAPYAGEVDFTFEGHWVAGGSYLRRITIANKTAQPYNVNYLRQIDDGGYFNLPAPYLAAGKSWTYLINRSIKGSHSEFSFGSTIGDAGCGDLGRNTWVIRP
ncbi:hypothetical protein [Amycolatopsis sp. WQ 127309]|uniref:hypothetical protein n=1 Tax=Amycolatopsis sp. WQ 127309 TaxID=2932773 RepID=UPI001FF263F6|nr:hypothetical protein [Amycolatopsis sp. WQ 127309]UOZ10733.1 hypothetical protein MUY22_21680 [Amycolatopsis sp. WQ 127309]